MSKYIDLELALNELLRLYEEDIDTFVVEIPETFDYQRAKEALMSIPTIEVVRCEDCKYFHKYVTPFGRCDFWHGCNRMDNSFCSSGKRREE